MLISVDDFYDVVTKEESPLVIDVRTPQEYLRGHIAGSENIPLDSLDKEVDDRKIARGRKLYVYCLSGSRSMIAVKILESKGYTSVKELQNGLLGWRVKRFPLEVNS